MRYLFGVFMTLLSASVFAAPTVTNVVAKQRYPWGLVDITCKVSGVTGGKAKYRFFVDAVFQNSNTIQRLKNILKMRNGKKSDDLFISDSGVYRLLWDAKDELGSVRYTNTIVRVVVDRDMVQLWEGGPYWATTNIGAEKPEDYGYYFWWGDTVGYKRENNKWVASDGSNWNFSFIASNTPTHNKSISTLQSEGWILSKNGAYVLAPEHDAAQAHWGGDWRMPTKQEFADLLGKCDWTWASTNGVKGYIVRGKGNYSSVSIFLPSAGYGYETSLLFAGPLGFYWSSVPDSDSDFNVWILEFNSDRHHTYFCTRSFGRTVRPLQGFTK